MNYNVLVTGCGGDIGQSIGKILNKQPLNNLIGCDISNKNAGPFIFDNFNLSLRCDDPEYLNYTENLLSRLPKYFVVRSYEIHDWFQLKVM